MTFLSPLVYQMGGDLPCHLHLVHLQLDICVEQLAQLSWILPTPCSIIASLIKTPKEVQVVAHPAL